MQPNETIEEFAMRTNYSGYDSPAYEEEKTSRNSNTEQGSITNDSGNHQLNATEAERNETYSDPNASNPNLTSTYPIDRDTIASVCFMSGDK
eukprot:12042590-Ditylum_brightwellii.AAC.1